MIFQIDKGTFIMTCSWYISVVQFMVPNMGEGGEGIFFIFFYKGIALPNNLLQSILKSEKNWKSCIFLKKICRLRGWVKKSGKKIELPNSDFLVYFWLFWPKVGFFLYFQTCSITLGQKKNIFLRSNRVIPLIALVILEDESSGLESDIDRTS